MSTTCTGDGAVPPALSMADAWVRVNAWGAEWGAILIGIGKRRCKVGVWEPTFTASNGAVRRWSFNVIGEGDTFEEALAMAEGK